MRRARWLQQKLGAVLCSIGHQHTAAADDFTLRAGPGTDARVQRPAVKVGVAFFVRDFFDTALDAHHALEFDPVKLQCSMRVASKLPAFAAVVIGKPDDTALVQALDQHHPRGRPQVTAHGGQCHGIGLRKLGRNGFFKPLGELLPGRCAGGVFIEFCALIAFAQVGDGFGVVCHG